MNVEYVCGCAFENDWLFGLSFGSLFDEILLKFQGRKWMSGY